MIIGAHTDIPGLFQRTPSQGIPAISLAMSSPVARSCWQEMCALNCGGNLLNRLTNKVTKCFALKRVVAIIKFRTVRSFASSANIISVFSALLTFINVACNAGLRI
jgi:hypothetical protein